MNDTLPDAYAEQFRAIAEQLPPRSYLPVYVDRERLLALLDAYSEACVDRDDAQQALSQIAALLRPMAQPYVQLGALLGYIT